MTWHYVSYNYFQSEIEKKNEVWSKNFPTTLKSAKKTLDTINIQFHLRQIHLRCLRILDFE